ncbi:YhgE/Pip domain-containing protein [Guptibacillus spartinae]|uniref:YhgE/Pip domain-containing protein n=1 Tax=Guptibacillus spartinae TaxID=3025679 RepID=UPI002361B89F|nr:ABC transporter permease [Pseudalkalibacillus spartinae]
MNKLGSNKFLLFTPIVVVAVIFIFSLTLFPSVNPTPKDLPIAILNEDTGVTLPAQGQLNMGNKISDSVVDSKATSQMVEWIKVSNMKELQEGLSNQEFYAAMRIPSDFSATQVSLKSPEPELSKIEVYMNQGMNKMGANIATNLFNRISENINYTIREENFTFYKSQGGNLTVEQAKSLVQPVSFNVTNVNEVGENSANGNAPLSLFQPFWMSSIAGAAMLYFAFKNRTNITRKEKLVASIKQLIAGSIVAIIAGFGFTWIAETIIGFTIPSFLDTAWFLTITYISFFLLISAVISWTGIKGIGLFALLLFFGAPLLSMPPEFMSSFYHDWVYSWLPMRFMVDGLRNLLFFDKEFILVGPTLTLLSISLVSIILLLLSSLIGNTTKKKSS